MEQNEIWKTKWRAYTPPMKIIQHPESFEVRSDDGAIVRQFSFDDNASRRAISGKMTKKQAFVAAKTFAGKGHVIVPIDETK
jgi:hypothetical protein